MLLKPLTESNRPQIKKWLSDEKLMYYMDTEKINPELGFFCWGIHVNDQLIGWTTLQNVDYNNRKAEFGIATPGITSSVSIKATVEVLKFAFRNLGMNRIYIRPLRSNLKENDMRERFGFAVEGIERQSVIRGNVVEDVVIFSILREEFERKWL